MIKSVAKTSYVSLLTPGVWNTVHLVGGDWAYANSFSTESEAEGEFLVAFEESRSCMLVAPDGNVVRVHDGLDPDDVDVYDERDAYGERA